MLDIFSLKASRVSFRSPVIYLVLGGGGGIINHVAKSQNFHTFDQIPQKPHMAITYIVRRETHQDVTDIGVRPEDEGFKFEEEDSGGSIDILNLPENNKKSGRGSSI